MSNLRITKTVNAPVEQVFARFSVFAGAPNDVAGIDRVEMLTDGPIGKGTRFKETRAMFGKEATEEMLVAEFEPNRKYTITAESCGAHYQTIFLFHQQGDKTEVDMQLSSRPITFMAKILSPIMGLMMGGTMKKMMQGDIDQVAAACEKAYN